MAGEVTELNEKTFDKFIKEGNCIIDFWAEWCGPCKIMEPEFKKAAKEIKSVKFAKVNVDDNYEIAGRFMVVSIPTMIFFKKGEQVDRLSGSVGLEEIKKRVKDNL